MLMFFMGLMLSYGQQCDQGECTNVPINNNRPWRVSHGSPSWGTNSVWLWSYSNSGEGVNYSGFNFVQGEEYCVSFTLNARTNTNQIPNANSRMNVVLTANPVIGNVSNSGGGTTPNVPAGSQSIMSQNIWSNGANQTTYQFTFVAGSNFSNLWFFPNNPAQPNPQIEVTLSDINICQITCEENQDVAFHFEHENGVVDTTFNLCEDVYLNASATLNTGSYFMDIWRVNGNGTLTWLSAQGANGWANGSLNTPINITNLFANDPQTPVNFQAGETYEVKLAINHPDCGWSFETHRFTVVEDSISSAFTLEYFCHDGVYDVTVTALDTDPNQWWRVIETSVQGSVADADVIGPASGIEGNITETFTNLDTNKFYFIKHGVWTTNCSWVETRIPLERDCCTDDPVIIPYCEDPCSLDTFPLKVKDKDGNIITQLGGAVFNWTNTVTNVTSTHDLVNATAADFWTLQLTMPDGCIYNLEYTLGCCDDDVDLVAYKCPTEEDTQNLEGLLNARRGDIDTQTFAKHQAFMKSYTEASAEGDGCDPCDTGLFIMKVVDDAGNLITNFNSITWSDGLYANQNMRWGQVNTLYTVTVTTTSSNGLETCTYEKEIIYECAQSCDALTAPTNLRSFNGSLSWDPVPGAVSYIVNSPRIVNVRCCADGISIAPIQTSATNVALSPILQSSCFVWQVTAVCADGTRSPVSVQQCHMPEVMEAEEEHVALGRTAFNVFPNPNKGDMNIDINLVKDTSVNLNVYSMDGMVVKSLKGLRTSNGKLQQNFQSGLSKGIYLFSFETGQEKIIKRVVIE